MNILNKALGWWKSNIPLQETNISFPIIENSNWHDEIIQNPIVYRCIKLIADNVASIPINIENDQPLIKNLLHKPNLSEDMNQLLQKIISSLLVYGEAYLLQVSFEDDIAIYSMDSRNITINSDEFGVVQSYEYQTIDGPRQEMVDQNGRSRILCIKNINPFGTNESPCKVIAESVQLYNAITKHNQALMNNAARFSGALIVNGHINDIQKKKLREEVDAKLGIRNAGHVAILQGDMRWEQMKANVRDADYTEGQMAVVRTIAAVFGVPPNMLGLIDGGFNHYKESRLHFWEDTLIPLAKYIISCLEQWLSYYIKQDIKLSLDLQKIPVLAEKTHKQMTSIGSLDFLSINEKRAMLGLDQIKNK